MGVVQARLAVIAIEDLEGVGTEMGISGLFLGSLQKTLPFFLGRHEGEKSCSENSNLERRHRVPRHEVIGYF